MAVKAELNYWDDMLMLLAFLAIASTGVLKFLWVNGAAKGLLTVLPPRVINPIHDWSGIVLVAAALLHLVLHWNWIVVNTKRRLGFR